MHMHICTNMYTLAHAHTNTHTHMNTHTHTHTHAGDSNIGVIVGAAVGAVVLIVILVVAIILAIYCYMMFSSHKRKQDAWVWDREWNRMWYVRNQNQTLTGTKYGNVWMWWCNELQQLQIEATSIQPGHFSTTWSARYSTYATLVLHSIC